MVFNRSARVAETMRSLTSWSSWSRLGLIGMPLLAAGLLIIGVLLAGTAGEVRAQTTPTVTIAASTTGAVTEGTPVVFTLTRTGDTAAALTVNVSVSETGKMLSGAPPTTATFPAGSATATLTVPTDDDNVDEVIQGWRQWTSTRPRRRLRRHSATVACRDRLQRRHARLGLGHGHRQRRPGHAPSRSSF